MRLTIVTTGRDGRDKVALNVWKLCAISWTQPASELTSSKYLIHIRSDLWSSPHEVVRCGKLWSRDWTLTTTSCGPGLKPASRRGTKTTSIAIVCELSSVSTGVFVGTAYTTWISPIAPPWLTNWSPSPGIFRLPWSAYRAGTFSVTSSPMLGAAATIHIARKMTRQFREVGYIEPNVFVPQLVCNQMKCLEIFDDIW